MIVCVCRRVSDRDIHRAVHDGARSFDDVQIDLGVATACGSCLDCAQATWAEACSRTCGALAALIWARASQAFSMAACRVEVVMRRGVKR